MNSLLDLRLVWKAAHGASGQRALLQLACAVMAMTQWGCSDNTAKTPASAQAPTSAASPTVAPEISVSSTESHGVAEAAATLELIEACRRDGGTTLILRTPVDTAMLEQIASLTQLETLELYQARFSPGHIRGLHELRDLRRLRLEDLPLDDTSLTQLGDMTKLEILNIPATVLSDVGAKVLVSAMPNLSLLRIGSPHITDDGIRSLADLQQLRFLHFVNVPVTDRGLEVFHGMDHLESFYIDGGAETEEGIRALLRKNPRLHFHRNQLHVADDPNADAHGS